ncbi:aa3-type cytochrome c oxidase subunit IV [Maricaulis parjimensis]|uniref:aa3-type cytochrome c oxidase subunit IV n=1 Tax=Maricaulis parjimensis TaxID=144023 RepID=UPI00193993F6|nr:aa3-type cytochrome c oxidase subunit IV [Maricaulis parjimensis]
MATEHVRGEMDIADHKATFDGFMAVSTWGGLLTALTVFLLTLIFAVGMDWIGALIGTTVVGIIAGLVMKMSTAWYVTLGGLFVFTLICGGIAQLAGMALAG